MAVTPLVSGPRQLASEITSGAKGRIAFVGDSVTLLLRAAPYQVFARTGIRGYGQGDRWSTLANSTGWTAGNVTDFVDPLDGGGWWRQVDFDGGVTDGAGAATVNNIGYIGMLGPAFRNNTTIMQRMLFGRDWMDETLDAGGRAMRVRFPIYKHPDGPQNADCYFQVFNASTVLATSPFFNGFAAVAAYEYVEATIPAGVYGAFTQLQVRFRFRDATATESGKTLYLSAHGTVVDETIATGQELHFFAQGGATVDNYNDPSWVSDQALGLLTLIDPDVIAICLGLNDSSGSSAATFATEMQALVTRLRGFCPTADIVLIAPHARQSFGDRFGGEGDEPYYTPGMYQAHQAIPGSLFVNMCRLLPDAGIMSGLLRRDHASIATGQTIWRNMVVTDAGNMYVAKAFHQKIATAPGADAVNWTLVAATASTSTQEPFAWDVNPVLQDGLHPHQGGNVVWMQTFFNGLQLAQESGTMAALIQTAANVIAGSNAKKATVTAGGTVTAGMPVYKDAADGNKYKAARANVADTSVVGGIALNSASNGQPLSIQTSGDINLGATLVVGETYYASDAVAGQIVPGADLGSGDIPFVLGQAETASNLVMNLFTAGVPKA